MSTYALQTEAMRKPLSRSTSHNLGYVPQRDHDPKSQLPTKRKRDSICGLGTFTQPFTVKPCPDSPYDKPATFKPIRVIGRAQLPLTFLDTSLDDHIPPNRLFSARIDVLEGDSQSQGKEGGLPKVLVARYETKKTLYAIERVQPRVYSLCRLANWLKEKDVASLWDPSTLILYPTLPSEGAVELEKDTWWQQAVTEATVEEQPAKRVRISMLRPKPRQNHPPPTNAIGEGLPHENTAQDSITLSVPEATIEAPSPQQLLENLVQQYLDAVYLSKMSLAYFAKGPVTRIRAAFTSPEEGVPSTYDLVVSLRAMLLSHKASDKKYREKLPEWIKLFPPGSFSDDEHAEEATKPKKSKKKVKLSRDGVYPQEEGVVRKWWMTEILSPDAYGEETIDQRIKRRIGDLRVRETLAQMIIMLEIVALEALSTYRDPTAEEESKEDTQVQDETQPKPKKRKKKLDDIKLQLDLLLDKLCIWQSVDQEGILDFDSKPSKDDVVTDSSGRGGNSDRLQSFCVEVIVPFYMSRLPDQARMINKKLGGPAPSSPSKRKALRPPMATRKSGEPKEPESKRSRRSLGRVATDTTGQTAQRKPTPSLHRSNTDSTLLNGIKREGSEVPLSAIPLQRSPSQAARRSMSQFRHLKGREVDLTTPSAAAAAKLQQKKRVEDEVKEAIAALKKPNRGLAAGGYVDDIERRSLGSSSKSRKPTTTVRKVIKDVQVSATPRTIRRSKDMIEQTPLRHRNPFVRDSESDAPPSSNYCIPSSAVRPTSSTVPGTVQRSATARNLGGSSVAETPSKAPSEKVFSSSGAIRRTIFATPIKGRPTSPRPDKTMSQPAAIFATPMKESPITVTSFAKPTHTAPAVFATPTKEKAAAAVSESPLPAYTQPRKAEEEPSIYDALGWNDDDDLF